MTQWALSLPDDSVLDFSVSNAMSVKVSAVTSIDTSPVSQIANETELASTEVTTASQDFTDNNTDVDSVNDIAGISH